MCVGTHAHGCLHIPEGHRENESSPGAWWPGVWLSSSSYRPPDPVPSIPGSRALYDRLAEGEPELSFKKDDILYVDDTLPQGTFGSWMAWQLDENAQKIQRGQIPSKYV